MAIVGEATLITFDWTLLYHLVIFYILLGFINLNLFIYNNNVPPNFIFKHDAHFYNNVVIFR